MTSVRLAQTVFISLIGDDLHWQDAETRRQPNVVILHYYLGCNALPLSFRVLTHSLCVHIYINPWRLSAYTPQTEVVYVWVSVLAFYYLLGTVSGVNTDFVDKA